MRSPGPPSSPPSDGAKYKGLTLAADAGNWNHERRQARVGFAGDWGSGHLQTPHRSSDDWYWQSAYGADYVDGNLRFFLSDTSDLTLGFETSDREKDKHGSVKGATQAVSDSQGTIGRNYSRRYAVDLQKFNLTHSNDLAPGSNLLATTSNTRTTPPSGRHRSGSAPPARPSATHPPAPRTNTPPSTTNTRFNAA